MTITLQRGNDVLSTPFCKGYILFYSILKSQKDLLLSLYSHLKKQNLDRRTLYSQRSITHIIFGGHNAVQMFW